MQTIDIQQALTNLVITFAAFLGGAIALSLLYAAYLFIFCADDAQQEYRARRIIGYCILGGIIGLGALTIATLIHNSITNQLVPARPGGPTNG